MRIYYDSKGKKISKKELEVLKNELDPTVGLKEDIRLNVIIKQGMSNEQFIKMLGGSYKDYERKNK